MRGNPSMFSSISTPEGIYGPPASSSPQCQPQDKRKLLQPGYLLILLQFQCDGEDQPCSTPFRRNLSIPFCSDMSLSLQCLHLLCLPPFRPQKVGDSSCRLIHLHVNARRR